MSDTKIKSSNIAGLAVTHDKLHTTMDLTSKTVTVATPSAATHPATKAYVDSEVAGLIDSAPGTLNTLNELAAAVNDDANFNATIASSIATKLPLAGGTMTGAIDMGANNITTTGKVLFGNVYATEGDLPSGSTYHGMFAHVHATGKGYYSHAGAWVQLANAGASGGGYEDADTAAYLATDQNKTINTAAGNVGIGIAAASTTAKLHIKAKDSGYTGGIQIEDTDSATKSAITHVNGGLFVSSNATADNLSILASGNVGIGTASPVSNHKMTIKETASENASIVFTDTDDMVGAYVGMARGTDQIVTGATNVDLVLGTAYTADTHLIANNAIGLTVKDGGNVGIGTASPVDKLDIRGNVTQIDGSPEYHFAPSSASHHNWRIAAQEAVNTGFEIASGTQVAGTSATSDTYTNRLVILANGNVGIGTDAPSVKLHVVGGADANLYLKSDSSRSGAFLMKPGTNTVMGSLLQLADESYRLGTAGHYHIQMYQNGQTLINPDGDSVKIGGGGMVDSTNTQFNMEFPATGGIAIGGGYTFANIYGDASGNLFLKANAYPASIGSSSRVELRAANSGGGMSSPLVWYDNGQLGLNNLTPEYAIDINGNNFNRSSIRMVRTDGGINNDTAVVFKQNAGTASGHGLGGLWFGNSNYDSGDNAYALIRARTQDVGSSGKLQFITSNAAVSNTTAPALTINKGNDFLIGGQFNYHVISGSSAPNIAFQYDFYRNTYGIPMKITCAISHWNGGYMSFTEGMYWGYNTVMSSSVHHVYNGGNGSWTISFPTNNIVRVRMNGDASYAYASGWYIKVEGNLRREWTSG